MDGVCDFEQALPDQLCPSAKITVRVRVRLRVRVRVRVRDGTPPGTSIRVTLRGWNTSGDFAANLSSAIDFHLQ